MWRTATDQQIASVIGRVANPRRWHDMSMLFSAGLVDCGTVVSAHPKVKMPHLYRVGEVGRVEDFLSELTYAEWLSVTGGQPIQRGSQFDRHNIMTTELALRCAEFCEVKAVFGEPMASHDLLNPVRPKADISRLVPEAPAKRHRDSGDAVLVRYDGLRIVVEMTAHAASTERKVAKWVELLGQADYEDAGTVVLFVEMGQRGRLGSGAEYRKLKRAIDRHLKTIPDAASRRLHERFAVARWQWWFPDAYVVSSGFLTLQCDRPTGTGDNPWQLCSLLDKMDCTFVPKRQDDFEAVFENANLLRGTPYWLRTADAALDLPPGQADEELSGANIAG